MCSLFERGGAALILAVVVACAWPAWAQKPLTARQVIEKIKLQIGVPVTFIPAGEPFQSSR